MNLKTTTAILAILCCVGARAELSFVTPPSMTDNGGTWTISFEVSESTDVEVAIVDMRDSTIVRHLAAGVLGANPPAPLAANTLSQTLVWDGKDDLGNMLSIPAENISVRVRAGMAAEFEQFVGGNPYAFKDENSGYWSFNGMVEDDQGTIYVSGTSEPQQFSCIRAYDGNGDYLRTVFPFRGDFLQTQVSGFGVNNWLNNSYSPKFVELRGPTITNTILSVFNGYSMLPVGGPGEIAVGGGKGLQCLKLNVDGTMPAGGTQVALITSPALPDHYSVYGPMYLNKSHTPDYIYLSGYYSCELGLGAGGYYWKSAPDTGFWRDGCVYKINVRTGEAEQFIALDSVPTDGTTRDTIFGMPNGYTASLHSLKTAANGDVLLCDRLHKQIGVYDSNGVFKGAIRNVMGPDQVAIDPVTGAVYVACRNGWHYDPKPMVLNKYSGYGPADSLQYSVTLWQNYGEGCTYMNIRPGNDGKPRIWIAHGDVGVRIYRDEGDTVALIKDFYATKVNNLGFDRIGIDRRSETVFLTNGANDLFKVTDWENPAIVRCSTEAKQPLKAGDICVSYDNQLYLREQGSDGSSPWNGPIARYSMDYYHSPIPFANTGTHKMGPEVYGRMGVGFADKGLAVSPVDKHVTYMGQHDFGYYWIDTLEAEGTTDTVTNGSQWRPRTIVNITGATWNTCGQGCVKFDLKGNLYFGVTIATPDHRSPVGWESDFAWPRGGRGSVVCYAPGDTGSIVGNTATNSKYIYKANLGPMSYAQGGCQCRSSRFDVDAYGRLFVPSGVTQKVSVVDNNDNPIIEFGQYGNWDEQGSGSTIPFACPMAAAASENYIYVNDLINTRMARIKTAYALDNMPGLDAHTGTSVQAALGVLPVITAMPNPFNQNVTIRLSAVRQVSELAVYDIQGKRVADLKPLMRNNTASWRAKAPAGVYFVKAVADGKRLIRQVLLVK